jgi:hypothetical protein
MDSGAVMSRSNDGSPAWLPCHADRSPSTSETPRIMTRSQIRRAWRATANVLREAVLVVIALMAVMAFAG